MRRSPLSAQGLLLCVALLSRGLIAASASWAEMDADTDTRVAAPQWMRALYALQVNGVDQGVLVVALRNGDMFVNIADLARGGLSELPVGERETIDGQVFVSLASLAPLVRFERDEKSLSVSVMADPALLPSHALDLRTSVSAVDLLDERPSGFFNYAARVTQELKPQGFGEAGASMKGFFLYSGFSASKDTGFLRGLTNLTCDQPRELRRWIAGDHAAGSGGVLDGGLGGTLLLGGFGVARDFSLDPYFDRAQRPQLAGSVTTPSKLDVYVDGRLVRSESVAPGAFSVANLPVIEGGGTAQVVLRDAFGRTQEVAASYYFTNSVLLRGLSDYAYDAGFRRPDLSKNDYGGAALLARHRYGFTDSITAGLRLDAARNLVSGGPGVTVRLPFGVVELDTSFSRDGGRTGAAGAFGYTWLSSRLRFSAQVRAMSLQYANASLGSLDDRAKVQLNVAAGTSLLANRLGFGAVYNASWTRDRGSSQLPSAVVSLSLGSLSAFVSAGVLRREDSTTEPQVLASIAWVLGQRTVADASFSAQSGTSGASTHLQRSIDPGPGYGYRVGGSVGASSAVDAQVEGQNGFGHALAAWQRIGSTNYAELDLAGGLVAMSGQVFATRPVRQGYALIEVPGMGGVRGFLDNQEMGRTDGDGFLFVPDVSPYYAHKLSIATTDLPMTSATPRTEARAASPFRAGSLVRFAVEPMRSVTGVLSIDARKRVVPAYGELSATVSGKTVKSPLDEGGNFYLENVPAGSWPAQVVYKEGTCAFVLQVPKSSEPVLDLGAVSCKPAR